MCGRLLVRVRRSALAERDDRGPALDHAVHDLSEFFDGLVLDVIFESAGVSHQALPARAAAARAGGVAGSRDRQARTDQLDSPDRMEPWLTKEPIDSSEENEPTDPIDRIEPADPIERIDPADPMDRMDPLEPMLRIDPAEPLARCAVSPVRMRPFSQPVGKMVPCAATRSPS